MILAQLRGAKFEIVGKHQHPETGDHYFTAIEILSEVAEWLGFSGIAEYIATLPIERRKIFKRATY